jgi:Cu/Ag efflux protein CusF
MKSRIGMVLITCSTLIIGLMLIMLCASTVPPAFAGDPCCGITGMAAGGLVTAQETATGKTFQFQVTDPALLKSLRMGQTIHADFTTMKVSVQPDGIEPCCNIASAASGPTGTAKLPNAPMPTMHRGDPCCRITGMAAGGLVTAQETATGKTFQFQVTNQVLLKSLRVGQKVYADFGTQQVSVDGASPCCGIVSAAGGPTGTTKLPGAPMPTVHGGTPCCGITGMAAGGLVTAQDTATGKTFQFQVTNQVLAKSLRVGQKVYADFGTQQVSVDGISPCCGIVSAASGPTGTAKLPGAPMPTVHGADPCCNVVANAALKGRLGRVVVAFPDGAVPKNTRVDVLKDGKVAQGGYGNQSWELLSGTYEVSVSGKRVSNVTVKAGHDTTVRVGVLRVSAGTDTSVGVLDGGNKLTSGYGNQVIGLPPGSFDIQVAGQTERITISEGTVTDF